MAQTPYEWYNQQMVNKQEREGMTAVEWLMKQLLKYGFITVHDLKKAKEIEKEQIVDAWDLSRRDIDYPANGEEYYNDNYNK
jgi:hypothetical protein